MSKLLHWIRGTTIEDETIPICPDHGVEMDMFKKVGKPTRFSDQATQTYTLLYRCPVPTCNHAAERQRVRNQIPVASEITPRPVWSKRDRTRV